jgi:hypothetical protein
MFGGDRLVWVHFSFGDAEFTFMTSKNNLPFFAVLYHVTVKSLKYKEVLQKTEEISLFQ